jgi:hypothetical protein
VASVGLVVLVAAVYFVYGSEFMKVDRCLDAGGRWNYELKQCEYKW